MKTIGLCGKSGSGKGFVSKIFNDFGFTSIDTDKVYHDLISYDSDCTKELVSYFGSSISASPGIDRRKLRDIVFKSEKNLDTLNLIAHKHILNKVRLMIDQVKTNSGFRGIIIDAPVLFESGFDKECDLTVCVVSDEETRINRIIKRDGITYEDALTRIRSQMSDEQLISRCDYTIYNNSNEEELREAISKLVDKLF